MSLLVPYKGNSDFVQGVREQGGPSGNSGQKVKMALEAFWKAPLLGGHMFTISVCMAGDWGGGLSWPVAKPDVCCVTSHSTELSNPSLYWEFVCHSYDQLHPVTQKVSKVLWAKAGPRHSKGGGRLASHSLIPPC